MTSQQRKVLLYIQDQLDAGHSVALQDIADHCGLKAKSGAFRIVQVLVDLGYITKTKYRNRTLTVIKRIEPIFEAYVWDDNDKELVRFVDSR